MAKRPPLVRHVFVKTHRDARVEQSEEPALLLLLLCLALRSLCGPQRALGTPHGLDGPLHIAERRRVLVDARVSLRTVEGGLGGGDVGIQLEERGAAQRLRRRRRRRREPVKECCIGLKQPLELRAAREEEMRLGPEHPEHLREVAHLLLGLPPARRLVLSLAELLGKRNCAFRGRIGQFLIRREALRNLKTKHR
eukprot:4184996-Pleurochrysis_carterae.AAC.2